jgi:hypothetical protein
MKIDIETLKAMKDIMTPPNQHMGQVVPVSTPDKDSFSTFTSGLRDNWIFVMAIFAFSLWLLQNINTVTATNNYQDTQIKTNIEDISQAQADIEQNEKNIQTVNSSQITNYNDVIRRLDQLQASIDSVKKE